MKKLLAILLACAMIFVFIAACANGGGADDDDLRVALVAHGPASILEDGSFNEGSWNGIANFLAANGYDTTRGVHREFFQAHEASDEARIDVMDDAINVWGAQILILPGFDFAGAVYQAQDLFPDAKFVILDARPNFGPYEAANTISILYAEDEAGFLAGYAAVMEGFTELGFLGGRAVPAVVRFGHGFILGAEYAAGELGLSAGDITVTYAYADQFAPDPRFVTMAGSWFAAGTEVIFAAAGGVGFNVFEAADAADAWAIGVDADQSGASPRVITSAMKGLDVSVYDMLTDFVAGTFRGGNSLFYSASNNGVGLPLESSRFSNFTQSQYDAIFAQLADGSISLGVDSGAQMPSEDAALSNLTFVVIIEN